METTISELDDNFGGCRVTPGKRQPAFVGHWVHEGQLYVEPVVQFVAEAPYRTANYAWLSRYKRILEKRFEQIEMYIIVTEIRRIVQAPEKEAFLWQSGGMMDATTTQHSGLSRFGAQGSTT